MWYHKPGRYVFRITSQGWVETEKRKLPMLVFDGYPTHLITKNPEGEEQLEQVFEDPEKPFRTLRLCIDSHDENMMDFVMKKLRHAGFEGDSFNDLNLVNADVRATCKEGEFNGKPTENWDFMLPPLDEPAEVNTLDTAMNRKLDALFGKRLKGGKPKQVEAAPDTQEPPLEPVSEPVADYDIPF